MRATVVTLAVLVAASACAGGADWSTSPAGTTTAGCLDEAGATEDVGDTLDELREVAPSQTAFDACVLTAEQEPAPPANRPTGRAA